MENHKTAFRFVSINTAAEMIGVSASTVRRLIDSGNFPKPFHVTENRIVLLESDIHSWMAEVYQNREAANDN